jgi:hypothetical protein
MSETATSPTVATHYTATYDRYRGGVTVHRYDEVERNEFGMHARRDGSPLVQWFPFDVTRHNGSGPLYGSLADALSALRREWAERLERECEDERDALKDAIEQAGDDLRRNLERLDRAIDYAST